MNAVAVGLAALFGGLIFLISLGSMFEPLPPNDGPNLLNVLGLMTSAALFLLAYALDIRAKVASIEAEVKKWAMVGMVVPEKGKEGRG